MYIFTDLKRFLSKFDIITIGIIAITLSCVRLCIAQEQNQRTPEQVIAYLSSLRHGLVERSMDEETKALLDDVVNNPKVYSNAISEAMQLRPNVLLGDQDYRQVGTALGLAKKIGSTFFAHQVRRFIEDATERLGNLRAKVKPQSAVNDKELQQEHDRVVSLRSSALDILGEFGDPGAVDLCMEKVLEEYEHMRGADVVMLRYLEKVALLRPDIRPKLEEIYNLSTSPLRNNPQLLRVLDAMDKAAAEQNKSKNDRKDQERKEE